MRLRGSQFSALASAPQGFPLASRAGCLAHGAPALTVLGPGPELPWSMQLPPGPPVISGIGPRVAPSHSEQPIVQPFLRAQGETKMGGAGGRRGSGWEGAHENQKQLCPFAPLSSVELFPAG